MTVAKFVQPDHTSQDSATYKNNINASISVMATIAAMFAPHAQDTPNMTIKIDAGSLLVGSSIISQNAQNTGTIVAPTSNPRLDLVVIDAVTAALAVITGTEAVSPSLPAIPISKMPVAQIALSVSQTSIINSNITDLRIGAGGSGGGIAITQASGDNTTAIATTAYADRNRLKKQVFTSNGSWTNPMYGSGLDLIVWILAVGAGGGGGGGNSTYGGCGGGGGASVYMPVVIPSSVQTVTVTIGTGGAAGASSAGTGGNGGASSFGSYVTANGGAGGAGGISLTGNSAGGPAMSRYTLQVVAFANAGSTNNYSAGGDSGNGYGQGGSGGNPGALYGGGGGGKASSGAGVGYAGANGLVTVWY